VFPVDVKKDRFRRPTWEKEHAKLTPKQLDTMLRTVQQQIVKLHLHAAKISQAAQHPESADDDGIDVKAAVEGLAKALEVARTTVTGYRMVNEFLCRNDVQHGWTEALNIFGVVQAKDGPWTTELLTEITAENASKKALHVAARSTDDTVEVPLQFFRTRSPSGVGPPRFRSNRGGFVPRRRDPPRFEDAGHRGGFTDRRGGFRGSRRGSYSGRRPSRQ